MGKYLDNIGLSHFMSLIKSAIAGIVYAGAPSAGGNANKSNAMLYGTVDSTSTATAFTATVSGLDALTDGTCVMLHNGVITSAEGFTVDINGLGAKPCYSNMTNATRDTTIFNAAYTMLFVYSTALNDGGGGWWIYRGFNSNDNTIGYQLRTNSATHLAADKGYRYRIWLTSADGTKWVPINTSTSTNATTSRTLNTRKIDPFGPIVYRSTNGTQNASEALGATAIWQQYNITIGYSYVISMTANSPVFLKCTPQTDGSAAMSTLVQTLPSSNDGYIYILLGIATSSTAMELRTEHPVYWHDGTGIRIWTGAKPPTKTSDLTNDSGFITDAGVTSFNGSTGAVTYTAPVTSVNGSTGEVTVSVPSASSSNPVMDGTAAAGTSSNYARADHVHPTDTSRAASSHNHAASDINSGTMDISRIPTGTGSTQVALGNHTHSSYVNQNAFSNVKVGSTTVAADSATDTLELVAGDNVTLTPDATNDKVTIAATDTVYTHPAYTEASAAAIKVGRDATGHVVTGAALTASDVGAAPTAHASSSDTYGKGTDSNYGHVKLSDSTSSSTAASSGGTAATPKAVKAAYDLASGANTTAGQALSAATGAYVLKVTYTISSSTVTCSAHVYSGGQDVTADHAASCFSWSYLLIASGSPSWTSLGTGKTKDVTLATLGLGGNVKCEFTPAS